VIVLDNASGDGTVEMIRAEFPDVRLLVLEENLGFAAGVNRAAEEARGEYVLLLNPDTVVHDGALDSLVRFARAHPEHGLVGGRTLDPDGTVNPGSCWAQPTLWSLACFATMLSTAFRGSRLFDPEAIGGWRRDSVREVGIVTGCLLLVPRALWRELGGFDTRFFMYGEDADLAMRAWARGLRPAITPDAVVTHEIGVSSSSRPDKLVLLFRGKATLLRKHWSPARRELGLALLRLGVGVRALLARGREDRAGAWPDVWASRKSWLAGYAEAPPNEASSADREPAVVK
jgi:N-acetylglucosaminyl-diphospho-decaprenol L-rhamnosyltransferase